MPKASIAFDRSSVRRSDDNGYLHVSESHITKEQVVDYYGEEVPGWRELGLDPKKIYQVYRPGEELKKAEGTFNNLPILFTHTPVVAGQFSQVKDKVIGNTGEKSTFDGEYLNNSLSFWDAEYIAKIEDETQKELSAAYRYTPVMESGSFQGKPYQIKMTDIKGNHVITTEEGRAGSDVTVADSKPKTERAMKKSDKRVEAEKKLLGFAMDSKKPTVKALAAKWLGFAMDSDETEKKEDELLSGLEAVQAEEEKEDEPIANDEEGEGGFIAALEALIAKYKGAGAEDGDMPTEKPGEKPDAPMEEKKPAFHITQAQDSASIKKDLQAQARAAQDVEPIVGRIDTFAFDSAAAIYGYALDSLKIDKKGQPEAAYEGMVKVYLSIPKAGQIAQDSANTGELLTAFPELKNAKGR